MRAIDRRTAVVAYAVALCALAVCVLWAGPLAGVSRPVGRGPHLDAVLLAIMFGATETAVLHLQLRRESRTISLSEIPLVLGLVFASPGSLLVGRVVGAAAVLAMYRRQPLVKLVYNVAMMVVEVSVALWVFHAIEPAHGRVTVRGIAAVYLAVVAAAVVNGLALRTVIGICQRDLSVRAYLDEVVTFAPVTAAVATFGFVAVYALRYGSEGAWALLLSVAVLLVTYRVHTRLFQRHQSLEQLFRFAQVIGTSTDVDDVLRQVLEEARVMFQAEVASIAVLPGDDELVWRIATLGAGDRLHRGEIVRGDADVELYWRAAQSDGPELLTTGAAAADVRQLVQRAGWRDALAAPLRDGRGVLGALVVADRRGDATRFDGDDLPLLATMSNQATVALRTSRLIDRLRHAATHDILTGLPNRAGWESVTAASVARATETGELAAVLLLGLDGLKDINDTLGHRHGDALLIDVSHRIVSTVRSAGVTARLEGDEFAVFLPATSEDAALALAEAIVSAMHEPFSLQELRIEVQAFVGVTWAPHHGGDLAELLKRADVAMYSSKRTTSSVTVYDPSLDQNGPNRLALIADLRKALTSDEIVITVQPKVSLTTAELSSVEVLARWTHPDQGPISPVVFVPLAERSGLIRELTDCVIEKALAACAEWRHHGVEIPVAVNVSARALLDREFAGSVQAALARHDIPARLLIIEITESSVMSDPDRAIAILQELRDAGVALSVDDFGTGYSSLSYLKRLPVHEVKIDRSFVMNLADDESDATIVRAIVDLGGNLGLDVVAEGVEDLTTWRRLQELGCTTAQGYYLGRPMPPGRLLRWRDEHADATEALSLVPGQRRARVAMLPGRTG